MSRMYEYELQRKIDRLKREIDEVQELRKKMLSGVSKRLNIDPRIAEELFMDLFMSDHPGLQQGIDDLFLQTKLIHPEKASKVSADIKKEERAKKEQKELRKKEDEEHQSLVDAYHLRVRQEEERNAKIVENNEIKVKLRLKKLDGLLATPYPYDNLGTSFIHLIQVLGDDIKLERSGFLWHKVRKVSGDLSFAKGSKAYRFMMAEGLLEKESNVKFEVPQHPRDYSRHYFSMYN